MNIRIRSRLALALLFVTTIFCTAKKSIAADAHPPFAGEKTTWHSGFDRYDFIMDDATGANHTDEGP